MGKKAKSNSASTLLIFYTRKVSILHRVNQSTMTMGRSNSQDWRPLVISRKDLNTLRANYKNKYFLDINKRTRAYIKEHKISLSDEATMPLQICHRSTIQHLRFKTQIGQAFDLGVQGPDNESRVFLMQEPFLQMQQRLLA